MKLFSKYNRVNLFTAIVVILITAGIYYQAVSIILNRQVDQDLEVEEQEIFDFVRINNHLPQVFKSTDQQISFQFIEDGKVLRHFLNTRFYNQKEKEKESGRGLISAVVVGGRTYKILIVESKVETEDLVKIIFEITLAMILILLGVLSIINRLVLRHLWLPFYGSLLNLKAFDVAGKKKYLEYKKSGIEEFDELNEAINLMAEKVIKDYNELKTFIENASHELMTPIAVINAKLDNLLQTDQFSKSQSGLLEDLYHSVARLTQLNKGMLLLAKIENQILPDKKSIRLDALLNDQLQRFQELFAVKNIQVDSSIALKKVEANEYLLEILLTNLIGNAVRHNVENGMIQIGLDHDQMIIANTGKPEPLLEKEIYNRFTKSPESEGSGLGLTISQQICITNNWTLNYRYKSQMHCFIIRFGPITNADTL